MSVDLRQLAIDRGSTSTSKVQIRRHWLTRYVLPGLLVTGFLSLVAWAGWEYVFPARPVTVAPVFSTLAEVQQEGTPLFKAAGWVEPRPTPVGVAALATGVVEQLLVVEDQPLRKGEPIAELVKDDAQLATERAEADLLLRQAELEEAQAVHLATVTRFNQPVHLQAELAQAEAALAKIVTACKKLPFQLRQAEAARDAAQKDYDGRSSSSGVVPGIEIQNAKSTLEAAHANVESLVAEKSSLEEERRALAQRRDALKQQLELLADELQARDEAEARVKAATARVQQARIALAEAKLRLDRMTIRAPVDGRILDLIGHPGSHVGGGTRQLHGHDGSTVVTMYVPERLQVRVDVRFEDIPHVSLGQAVQIENPALDTALTGNVLYVSSEADIQKNTLQVKVAIGSPSPVLKPETLVDVTFLAPETPEQVEDKAQVMRFYIPRRLVHQDDDGPFVWVADQSDGVARMTPVEIGSAGANNLVEIIRGIDASTRMIVTGTDGLKNGERIRIVGENNTIGDSEA